MSARRKGKYNTVCVCGVLSERHNLSYETCFCKTDLRSYSNIVGEKIFYEMFFFIAHTISYTYLNKIYTFRFFSMAFIWYVVHMFMAVLQNYNQ